MGPDPEGAETPASPKPIAPAQVSAEGTITPEEAVPSPGPEEPRLETDAVTPPPGETAASLPADGPSMPSISTAEEGREAPAIAIPPVRDVHDLDWDAVRLAADPSAIRGRMRGIVEGMETLLDAPGGPGLLFDRDRAGPDDRAIRIGAGAVGPLWIVGDLHGDVLALEAALAAMRREALDEGGPRIVFLGDLFDDEGFGLELLLRVFELILEAPERVCVVAGNHDEALSYDGVRFAATVSPSEFADFLNANLAHEWIERAGKLAVRFFARAPRALFCPDGLLLAHGGFPLADLHPRLAETGDWNDPACLADFVWTRAHPTARRKLPNRFSRGSQYGHGDFAAFCALATRLGRPVTHLVRGHDHVEERWAVYPAYQPTPVLTTVALSRRLPRESFGPPTRVPTLARTIERSLPQVYRLHVPPELILATYPGLAQPSEPADETIP